MLQDELDGLCKFIRYILDKQAHGRSRENLHVFLAMLLHPGFQKMFILPPLFHSATAFIEEVAGTCLESPQGARRTNRSPPFRLVPQVNRTEIVFLKTLVARTMLSTAPVSVEGFPHDFVESPQGAGYKFHSTKCPTY